MGILWKNWVASLTALATPDALDVVPVVDVSVDATKKSSMGDVATSNAFTSQFVASNDVRDIVQLTQAAYDLLTPDADTLYVIVG